MKWYKKQLDQLKQSKPELFKEVALGDRKAAKHKEKKKMPVKKVNNPVILRNINRPKTDA